MFQLNFLNKLTTCTSMENGGKQVHTRKLLYFCCMAQLYAKDVE